MMTREQIVENKIQILKDFLNKKGFKSTKQRNAIIEIFATLENQLNVEEIYKKVKRKVPNIGFATVYRTIKLLEKNGFAIRSHLGDGFSRFEPEFNQKNRLLFQCTECHTHHPVEDDELTYLFQTILEKKGIKFFAIKGEIKGMCEFCQKPLN
ncbi:MAG: transcriptional repressor [Deltaproteobacteria bacterium]|nr:transcriptional repressor [Deltaproteobacteria bacterium]